MILQLLHEQLVCSELALKMAAKRLQSRHQSKLYRKYK